MTTKTPTTTALEVGQLYFEVFHRIRRYADEAMTEAGLSLSRGKVLAVLAQHGPVKQATVAAVLGFAPRSVTDTVDALEREGLATRRPDPHDRRAHLVEITPAGTVALTRTDVVKHAVMDKIFGGLDDAERQQFAAALVAVRTRLDSHLEEAHVS